MNDIRAHTNDEHIEEEASLWLAQRELEKPEDFDTAGFNEWIQRDPRHRAAFEAMQAGEAVATEALRARVSQVVEFRSAKPTRRFALAGFALAAAAAAAMFIVGVPTRDAPINGHETEIAQIRQVSLPDGTLVTLGPVTRMDVAFTSTERRVVLGSGEAFFEVAHNADWPFYVTAGDTTVRVVGTKFDVRMTQDSVRIAVTDGVVQVQRASGRDRVMLRSGEAAQVDSTAASGSVPATLTRLAPVEAANAGMWREGRFAYVEAPLGELVADLNRYHPPGVRLADSRLATYRLTAAFRTNELDTFLATLPDAVPVTVSRAPDGAVTIASAN